MKRTVDIPADLARHVEAYLARRPGLTLSTLVQAALADRVRPANPREILRLAGLVEKASTTARRPAEAQDARMLVVQAIDPEGSPLDVPGVGTTLGPGELTRLLREQRKAAGARLITALSRRSRPTKARRARRASGTRKK